jgi:glutaminase
MQALLNEILDAVRPLIGQGKVANYIPALGTVAANQLGIAVYSNDGEMYCAGDAETAFSVQSISKVFSLVQAMSPPASLSTPWCNWSSNGAVRAIHSSMPEPW